MALAENQCWLGFQKFYESFIALTGKGEIYFGESTFVMRGERQRHLVKTDINIRVVVNFLRPLGDPIDESDAA